MKIRAILIAVVVLTAAGQTRADILAGGSNWREIAFGADFLSRHPSLGR